MGKSLRVSLVSGLVVAISTWLLSLFHLERFLGWGLTLLWLPVSIVATTLVFVVVQKSQPWERLSWIATAGVLIAVLLAVVFIYPQLNSQDPARGSDRDDALDVGARALMRFEWPYQHTTYQGSPISPMPGALLLAIPFVAIGSSAFQIPFWLAAFAYAVRRQTGSGLATLGVLIMLIPLWPSMLHEIVTGGDYILNTVYVLTLCLLVLDLARKPSVWPMCIVAALAGVAMSSRLTHVLTVPALIAAMWVISGKNRTLLAAFIAAAAFLLSTLPFYAYSPDTFTPLKMQDKLTTLSEALAGKAWLIGLIAVSANAIGAVLVIMNRVACLPGYLMCFALAMLVPGLVGASFQALWQQEVPLFIKWSAGSLPPILVYGVAYARGHVDGGRSNVAEPSLAASVE